MSNKTNQSAKIEIKANDFNFDLFKKLDKQVDKKGEEIYKINLAQGEIAKIGRDLYMQTESKNYDNIDAFIKSRYETSKNNFYRYINAYEIAKDVRDAYELQEKGQKTITKLIAYAKPKNENESTAKVENDLKISVKDGKITIKGSAKINDIDLLISELQAMKTKMNSPKAA